MHATTLPYTMPAPPASDPAPASLWQRISDRLDRIPLDDARAPKPHITVRVPPGTSDGPCALSIVVDGVLRTLRDIGRSGHFRFPWPEAGTVRLVFVRTGCLPRVISVQRVQNGDGSDPTRDLDLTLHLTPWAPVPEGHRTIPFPSATASGHSGWVITEQDRSPDLHQPGRPFLERACWS